IVMRRPIAAAWSSVAPKISSRWKLAGFPRASSTRDLVWSSRDLSRVISVCVESRRRLRSSTSAVIRACAVTKAEPLWTVSGACLTDRFDELDRIAVLVQIGGGAGTDRLEEGLLLVLGGEDDDADMRQLPPNALRDFEAGEARKVGLDHEHVGLELERLGDGF